MFLMMFRVIKRFSHIETIVVLEITSPKDELKTIDSMNVSVLGCSRYQCWMHKSKQMMRYIDCLQASISFLCFFGYAISNHLPRHVGTSWTLLLASPTPKTALAPNLICFLSKLAPNTWDGNFLELV